MVSGDNLFIFDQNLGMRNPLHRKKLQLALQAIGSEQVDDAGQLDYNWVTRWLDDIGLPQYKDAFSEARIDGRMLHYLSVVSSNLTLPAFCETDG